MVLEEFREEHPIEFDQRTESVTSSDHREHAGLLVVVGDGIGTPHQCNDRRNECLGCGRNQIIRKRTIKSSDISIEWFSKSSFAQSDLFELRFPHSIRSSQFPSFTEILRSRWRRSSLGIECPVRFCSHSFGRKSSFVELHRKSISTSVNGRFVSLDFSDVREEECEDFLSNVENDREHLEYSRQWNSATFEDQSTNPGLPIVSRFDSPASLVFSTDRHC